jgi:hypothetical protein
MVPQESRVWFKMNLCPYSVRPLGGHARYSLRPPGGRAYRVLSTPLVLTFIGFGLTGIGATYFSKHLDDLAKARDESSTKMARSIEAVREITDLLYERRTRGTMVVSSITRHAAPSEIIERKRAYDDAYVRWNTKLQSNILRIRNAFGHQRSSSYENYLNTYVVSLLSALDSCLANAYDLSLSNSEAAINQLSACDFTDKYKHEYKYKFTHLNRTLLHCSSSFADGLFYHVLRDDVAPGVAPKAAELEAEISKNCVPANNLP